MIDIFYTKIFDSELKLYPSYSNKLDINFINLIKYLLVLEDKLWKIGRVVFFAIYSEFIFWYSVSFYII